MITLVKFSAPWCGPCKKYGPIVEQVVNSRTDVLLMEIDIEENPTIAAQHGVQGVPFTMLKDEAGGILGGFQGAVAASKLHSILDEFTASK